MRTEMEKAANRLEQERISWERRQVGGRGVVGAADGEPAESLTLKVNLLLADLD